MSQAPGVNGTVNDNLLIQSLQNDSTLESVIVGPGTNLAQLLADIPAVLYECDSDLNITRISSNTRSLLGVNPQEMFGPEGLWRGKCFPDDREVLIGLVAELKCSQTTSMTHRIFNGCGLPIWVSHSIRKALTEQGEVLRGCILPLSHKACTQKVDAAIIPQFVHKIGNHFQLINLLVGNLCASKPLIPEVEKLQVAIDETVDFVRTLLDYAQEPISRTEISLSEILNVVIETMRPVSHEKEICLCHSYGSGMNDAALILGDSALIEKAFSAVVQNAFDAVGEAGQIEISVRRERHQSALDGCAHIVISDNGCGMDEQVLTRAVVPFFTTKRGRNGLGLSMALRIIEQHGGTLRIQSVATTGTQVHIVLPVVRTSELPVVEIE
jgi:two-component sensor histidine kinase